MEIIVGGGMAPGSNLAEGIPNLKKNTLPLLSLMPPTGGRISLTIFIRPDMAASLLAAQPPFLIL